ncbi:2,3,4,5-tetrahydropyridine-2,6-dicarboxylate N-succinyltransferase [Candidatus Vidania fulgoroideorum]
MRKKINKIYKKKILNKKEKIYIKNIFKKINCGKLKICVKKKQWKLNKYVKKAILLYFKIKKPIFKKNSINIFHDKFNNKFIKKNTNFFIKNKIRITCMSFVRYGSYISKNVIMMPCFVNVGARVGKGTLLDSWSTIGSCAQIGKKVHISGGVGIGGVLEPLNSKPVIIEDNCFIGARSEIVEGVLIKRNSVISMGVFIGKSTKIYDRNKKIFYKSYIPKNSVVVSGCLNYGFYCLYAAIIVKKKDNKTKKKIKINKILRK